MNDMTPQDLVFILAGEFFVDSEASRVLNYELIECKNYL